MPPKKRVVRRRAPQHGSGFFGDLWSGLKKVGGFVKDNKLISKGLDSAGLGKYAGVARQFGLGKRKVVRRKQVGGRMRVAPIRSVAGTGAIRV
jgi:hypothetical protein